MIFEELHASPYREHKLHFRTFLQAAGLPLLTAMAALDGRPPQANLISLDSIFDLEFYMPVPEHRASWQGDTNLIVVGQLEEHEPPIGYALNGEPVQNLSLAVPPITPTLVLVERETDFTRQPSRVECYEDCGGGGGGGGGSGGVDPSQYSQLWVVEMHLIDDHEPFTRGSPEIVIGTFRLGDGGLLLLACANEDKLDQSAFDMDDNDWRGEALVTPLSNLLPTTFQSSALTGIIIWEDDSGSKCDYEPETAWDEVPNQFEGARRGGYRADWRRFEQDNNGDGIPDEIKNVLWFIGIAVLWDILNNGDDLVGATTLRTGTTGFEDPKDIVAFLSTFAPAGNGSAKFQLR